MSDCLYPINIRTTEPIGPKFCVVHLAAVKPRASRSDGKLDGWA